MSFDNILDVVSELPDEQQESLIDIVKHRLIEKRREEIALNAKIALEDYHKGNLKSESAEEIIKRLHATIYNFN